jgi:2-keto-4-pentenoate hydratase/2-oxohepta-3-ene-1,7-dioic acid hydratase in catechol pathway
MASDGYSNGVDGGFSNYVAYRDPRCLRQERIGHLDLEKSMIQPLSFKSGAPISNLYEVIEIGDSNIKPSGEAVALSSVELLAPISGRDILAVGKNYSEHAKEFNSSGYDSSDKVDQPTHPVIFTKRSTSIIASGEPIFAHLGFDDTLDYEGEIGVIIGKSGFRIAEADAMSFVWGYTIINDMTARDRQRDHKQFYIGKSPDTFCPMVNPAVSNIQSKVDILYRAQLQCLQASSPNLFESKLGLMAKSVRVARLKISSFLSHSSSRRFQRLKPYSPET